MDHLVVFLDNGDNSRMSPGIRDYSELHRIIRYTFELQYAYIQTHELADVFDNTVHLLGLELGLTCFSMRTLKSR